MTRVSGDRLPRDPAPRDPAPRGPVPRDPVPRDPLPLDPVSRDLAATQPVIVDPPPTTPLSRWAPLCPLGHAQRPVSAHAHRDKGGGLLQLRVVARPSVEGVCAVIVQESFEIVLARVIFCSPDGNWGDGSEPLDCPARVWLDEPLDDRWVIDVESGRRLPPHEPHWS